MQQPKIIVAIRKRPLSKKQEGKGDTDIITIKNEQTLIVSEYKQKVDLTKYLEETVFNFDFAFNQYSTNQQIYQSAVKPLVQSAFQGAKVTCFAYGQTGSGKTHTMNGQPSQGIPGLYTLGAQDIFSYLEDSRFSHLTVRLSFFQIYCGKLFDLLNKRQELKIRQDNKSNINIIGLEQAVITSWQQFIQLLNYGAGQRVTSQNSANLDSSRSHAILQITLKQGKKIFGKISFIDLAGNQRGADHMDMSKQTRIDGAQINKSLLSLKQCIRALDQGKGHTPFRGSKLTMVLKDSFVGFCRTLMIGNISPSSASSENTLNTLRYADRVKQLRKPQQMVSKQDLKAKQLMLPRQNKNAIKIDINKDDDQDDINRKRQDARGSYGIINKQQQSLNSKVDEINHTRRGSFNNNNSNLNFGNNSNLTSKSIVNNVTISTNNQNLKGSFIQTQQPINTQIKNPVTNQNNKTNIINNPNNPINNYNNNNNNNKRVPFINQTDKGQQHVPKGLIKGYSDEPTNMPNLNRMNSYQLPNDRLYEFTHNYNYGSKMDIQNGQMPTKTNNYVKVTNNNNLNQNNQKQIPNNISSQIPNHISNQIPQNYMNNPYGLSQQYTRYQQPPLCQQPIYHQPIKDYGYQKTQSLATFPQSQPLPSYQPTQQYQIPNNWDQTIEAIQNTQNPGYLIKLQQSIGQSLLIQQTSLIDKHGNTLRSQIDIIKKQMGKISQLEVNRDFMTTREYVAFLQQNIEQKLSALELLRENLAQFTYKLDQLQEVQEKVQKIVGSHYQDQQLLDDLS